MKRELEEKKMAFERERLAKLEEEEKEKREMEEKKMAEKREIEEKKIALEREKLAQREERDAKEEEENRFGERISNEETCV